MSEVAVNTKSQRPSAPPIAPSVGSGNGSAIHSEDLSTLFKGLSATGAEQATQSLQIMRAAHEKLATVVEGACRVGAKESMEYASHLMQVAQSNFTSACELANALVAARSPSDVVNISGGHARKQMDVIVEQNRRLWVLAQKVSSAMLSSDKG